MNKFIFRMNEIVSAMELIIMCLSFEVAVLAKVKEQQSVSAERQCKACVSRFALATTLDSIRSRVTQEQTVYNQQWEVVFTSQTIRGGSHQFIGSDPISPSIPRGGFQRPLTSVLFP